MSTLRQLYSGISAIGILLQSIFLLAIRLFWGWEFLNAGLSKLQDIHAVGAYFETMGIVAPFLNAYAVGLTEFLGGALLIIGLATRLACLPLMTVMTVALFLTYPDAYQSIFNDPSTLMAQTPFTFLFAVIVLFLFGPGKLSLDALIKKFFAKPPVE